MPRRALLLAGLVVLAGCNGFLGGGTPTSSLTPAEVTDPTLAPGVTERGIVDARRLVDAHREAFRDGVVRTSRHRLTWANGTTAVLTERRVVGSDSCRRYLFTSTVVVGPRAPNEFSLYANGTHVFERRSHSGGTSTRLTTGPTGERTLPCSMGVMDPLGDERLYGVLGRGSYDVEVSPDRVTLTATDVSVSPVASQIGHITNITGDVEAVVTRDGAVRRLVVTYRGETPAGRVTGVRVDRFRASDGPEAPSWVANVSAGSATPPAATATPAQ